MKKPALPNVIVIGAMRAGTSSLYSYLNAHPQIAMSCHKELNFFIDHPTWPCSWKKGEAWYASQFDGRFAVRGEASPGYTNFPQFEGVPERMHSVVPDAKLIYLVRDPVARLVSGYRLMLAAGFEMQSLDETLQDLEIGVVARSCYFRQLERYLPFYQREQILIVTFEDLRDARAQTLHSIFTFLGVDPTFTSPCFDEVLNQSRHWMPRTKLERALASRVARLCYRFPNWQNVVTALGRWDKKTLSPALASALQEATAISDERLVALKEYLRPDLERFKNWTGRDYPQWDE